MVAFYGIMSEQLRYCNMVNLGMLRYRWLSFTNWHVALTAIYHVHCLHETDVGALLAAC